MNDSAIDRRVRRTRSSLQTALISLILEKGYDDITVEEICAAANVGRSTFYAHYTGKDNLKRRAIDDHLRTLFVERRNSMLSDASEGQPGVSATLVIFEHAHDHSNFCRAVVRGHGATVAIEAIRTTLSELLREELAPPQSGLSGRFLRELTVHYLVGAFMAVLVWWLEGGAKRPPHEMESLFRRLSTDGAMALLGDGPAIGADSGQAP